MFTLTTVGQDKTLAVNHVSGIYRVRRLERMILNNKPTPHVRHSN